MKGFITVTNAFTEQEVCINLAYLIEFGERKDGISCIVLAGRERAVAVKESYAVVKEMVEEATR